MNIADLFEHAVDAAPDKPAVKVGERTITYAELESESNRLAHFLDSRGIGAGDHVGLYAKNSIEHVVALLAILKVRAVAINVNYRYVAGELDYIFDNADLVAWAFAHTIALFLISGVLSLIFGTLLAAFRVGPIAVLAKAAGIYVTVVRNTPLLIVFVFFRIAGPKVGINFNFVDIVLGDLRMNNVFAASLAALTAYTSTFVCEALRSGVNTVPAGQAEAARSIGLTFGQSLREVILPQAFRGSIAPLGSVLIALTKNTTVASVIGVAEASNLMKVIIENETAGTFVFLVFAIGFVILTLPVGMLFTSLSRRLAVKR